MSVLQSPGDPSRRGLLRVLIGAAVVAATAARGQQAWANGSQVTIDNFTFAPTPLRVTRGATVTWVNHDDIPHSIVCPMLNLHSHPLDTNDSFAHRFDQPGTYAYLCGLHPHMQGQVIVQG